jgi:hypothetical protein
MKNLIFIVLTAIVFVSCEQKETNITPTFKESVEFSVVEPAFNVEDAIPAENIKNVAEAAEFDGSVDLKDIWLEVKTKKGNSANMALVNIVLTDKGNEIQLLNEDMVVVLEEDVTIVPLISILSAEGQNEIISKLNDIAAGNDDSNIELTLKGETFYSSGMTGSVDIDMEMFIRYSF